MRKKKGKAVCREPTSRTKRALDPIEITRIEKVAKSFGRMQGFDVYQLTMVLLYTGMHPKVLYDMKTSRLHRKDATHLEWFRPKITGSPSNTIVPIHHKLQPWIDEFIYSDFPQHRSTIWWIIKQVGHRADIPELSPMSLRHTFGCHLDELGFTPAEIKELMNCSIPVLMRYTSRTRKQIDNKLAERGWFDGEVKLKHDESEDPRPKERPKPEFAYHAEFDLEL